MSGNVSMKGALPFWGSLLLIPLAWIGAVAGGWTVLLVLFGSWVMVSVLDVLTGLNKKDEDPETPDAALFWYRLITWIWPFAQGATSATATKLH